MTVLSIVRKTSFQAIPREEGTQNQAHGGTFAGAANSGDPPARSNVASPESLSNETTLDALHAGLDCMTACSCWRSTFEDYRWRAFQLLAGSDEMRGV